MKDRYDSFSGRGVRNSLTARMRQIVLAGFSLTALPASGGFAQEPASEPCSAAGSQSLKSEKQLPQPELFGGVIKRDARESKPCNVCTGRNRFHPL